MKGGMRCVASGLAAWALLIGGAGSAMAQQPEQPRPQGPPGPISTEALVTLNAVDSGWYNSTGFHSAANKNYIAGDSENGIFRNFFVFSLAGYTDPNPIGAAELRLLNPRRGYSSTDTTETYSLFDVTTPITTLVATNTGRTDIFADLGSGLTYGSQVVSSADSPGIVSLALNANAVAALNANRGGLFALGGALTTIGRVMDEEFVFGFSGVPGFPGDDRQLVLTPVPEPATLMLLGAGAPVLLGYTWWRRRATAPA